MATVNLLDLEGIRLGSEGNGALAQLLDTPEIGAATRWVWLAYDQLNLEFLSSLETEESLGVVLIESSDKGQRRPYHQQKLGVLLSNQRHAAVEFQGTGVPVLYLICDMTYADVLRQLHAVVGTVDAFTHAERELRVEVEPLVVEGLLQLHPHPGWLTPRSWFEDSVGDQPPFRMDALY